MSPQNNEKTSILIVNGSCCIPQMAPVEDQVLHMVKKVIAEENIDASVRTMSMSQAYFGGIPRSILTPELDNFNSTGKLSLPVVLVNGKVVTRGVPEMETLKTALTGAGKSGEAVSGDQ